LTVGENVTLGIVAGGISEVIVLGHMWSSADLEHSWTPSELCRAEPVRFSLRELNT